MTTQTSDRDPVEALAESFVERLRRGEYPSVTEYTEKYPELADQIHDLFPTLAMVERLGPAPAKEADEQGSQLAAANGPVRQLGEYRIIREIGHGGMGVVYEAEQESLGRHVALKVLPAQAAADPTHLKRFHREARAAARLHHTNIVPVFEVGEHAGVHYYAMQFIQGQAMDEVLAELRRFKGESESDREPNREPVVPTETYHEHAGNLAHVESSTHAEHLASRAASAPGFVCGSGGIRGLTPPGSPSPVGRGKDEIARTVVHGLMSGEFARAADDLTEMAVGGPALAGSTPSESKDRLKPELQRPSDITKTEHTSLRRESILSESSGSGSSSSITLPGQVAGVSEPQRNYFQGVARVGQQVADALAHAHGQGVLHRDIKPSNLILDTHGVVWITDFGLAKNEGENLTHTGDVVGTLRYMAPERFRGRADARSDIYSLGLTLYEFIVRKPAFDASDRARMVQQVLHDEPARPRRLDRQIPRDLETIVLKAMDKEPRLRYQTAYEFADDLRLFLADRPIQARRASMPERLWRLCRRNPAVAGLAASVLSLLVVVAVGATLAAFQMRDHAFELRIENKRALSAEGLANRRLFESYRSEARAERFSRRPGQRFLSLTAIRNAAELLPSLELSPDEESQKRLELRNQAIASMALPDLRLVVSWPCEQRRTGWAFDAAVERYARGDMEGNVSIRRLSDDAELIRLPGFGLPVWSIQFSRDDRYVAARYQHAAPAKLYIWDLTSDNEPAVILKVERAADADAVDFSPDHRLVAIGRRDHSISIYNLADGQVQTRFPPGPPPTRLRFDPSGGKLAISSVDGQTVEGQKVHQVQVRHLATGKVETLRHPNGVRGIAWHPDGKFLATACANRRAYIWDTETGKRLSVLEGHEQPVVGVAFDPTGNLLASTTWGITRLWDVATRHELLAAEGHCGAFSSDGRRLGFINGWESGLWEVAAGREWQTLPTEATVYCLDVSPDGSLLAAATDGGVGLWQISTGKRTSQLAIGTTLAALFHPNGQELITSGTSGLLRWPLRQATEGALGPLHVGPPNKLDELSPNEGRAALDRSGQRIVIDMSSDHAVVIDMADPTKRIDLRGHPGLHYVALSPDGKWAATGTWQGNGVKVWDAESGKLDADLLPEAVSATVAFSPDSRSLVAGTGIEYSFFEVPSWRLKYRIARDRGGNHGGSIAFTCNGRMAAITHSRPLVDLIDPETGQLLATLEPPNPEAIGPLRFTPDGSHLAAESNNTIQLWDLRRIREQLATMGLDWELPSYAAADQRTATPLQVVVDLGASTGSRP